jgi:transposase-like protein
MSKRRNHQPEFKARVAIEALKGIKSLSEIAKEFQIHPGQISDWKKLLQKRLPDIFGRDKSPDSADQSAELMRAKIKIGELSLDLDYLKKKSSQLGLVIGSDSLSARALD